MIIYVLTNFFIIEYFDFIEILSIVIEWINTYVKCGYRRSLLFPPNKSDGSEAQRLKRFVYYELVFFLRKDKCW